jgi:DNA mismatch endonuclease (patch repair protein)
MVGIPSSGTRRHKGDIMSPEKRSALMSRIKGKNTGPEQRMAAALGELGLTWESHAGDLPGRPDFVFREEKVAIFVDGDFWHGWRFPRWRNKLSYKWETKIDGNRRRDVRNHRSLRHMGWKVVRLWEHQLRTDTQACVSRVLRQLKNTAPDSSAAWLAGDEPGGEK